MSSSSGDSDGYPRQWHQQQRGRHQQRSHSLNLAHGEYEIDHDEVTATHPFAFTFSALTSLAFRDVREAEYRPRAYELPTPPPTSAVLSPATTSALARLPVSRPPLVDAQTMPAPTKRKAAPLESTRPIPIQRSPPVQRSPRASPERRSAAKLRSQRNARSVSTSPSMPWLSEASLYTDAVRTAAPRTSPSAPSPLSATIPLSTVGSGGSPKQLVDHARHPDLFHKLLCMCSPDVLHAFYNTSRSMRMRVAPLMASHVVLSLRNARNDAAAVPTIDLQPYGCAAAPWFSWQGWENPKPVPASTSPSNNNSSLPSAYACSCSGAGAGPRGCDCVHAPPPVAQMIELPTFADSLTAGEARLTPALRGVLARAQVIDLVRHLRLPPRQPVLATPAVLRVHVHDRQVSQYARVDGPGWDEHTLDRFAPHTLVVLSRIIDYPSSDPLATALAVAPTCPVNEGTTHLVLRIAYDPADPRLPRSTIRVPTLYRPGLPSSVKNITIILVPNHKRSRDSVHHISEEPEWAPLDLTPAAKHYTPRLGMLDSTATWVAGYLPRGVKFTFVGVEELPETALNLPTGPAIRSANGLKAALLDSGAALSDAVRENIVRVRSHTSDHALDKAMGNLSLLSLAEYEATMGKAGFALRAHD